MHPSFQGQVAVIVGGTTGIGLASAQQFVAAGAQVVVAGRDAAKGEAAQALLGGSAAYLPCDIAQPQSVDSLFQAVMARWGRVDCAVNVAAIAPRTALLHETSDSEAAALLNTDVLGQFLCMKRELAIMLEQGGGTIVNVSSVNGLSGVPSAAMYSAGRHAVLGLTRSAALEYISRNIRINAVCPGAADTPRRRQRVQHLDPQAQAQVFAQTAQAIPIGRLATADEIASAIVWLSSPASSYVVGHCLAADGGLSA